MSDDGRGRLLFEYRPPRAHPIVYAGFLVFGAVFVMGSIENLLRSQDPDIYLAYAAPLVALLAFYVLWDPSPTRIHEHGIAPSRPRLIRGVRPFVRWDELAAVYPSYYDVTGAFVSPFASSDGKVTQMGLALEWPDGTTETVRFTPSRFTMWQAESAGYTGAMEAVRHAFGDRPLVASGERLEKPQVAALLEEANAPFLPFFAIVLLFASAAPVLALLQWLGMPIPWALAVSLVAPLWVSLRSYARSRRRHAILDRISRAAEHRRASRGAA